jgi:hypothetical protein
MVVSKIGFVMFPQNAAWECRRALDHTSRAMSRAKAALRLGDRRAFGTIRLSRQGLIIKG